MTAPPAIAVTVRLFAQLRQQGGADRLQRTVPAGTTEVTQVGALIDMIPAPAGTVVTADAAHTMPRQRNA